MSNELIRVIDLNKTYDNEACKTEVLHGLSFSVNEGEFVSIMGPSGCGKSTLLYLLGGLEKPTAGQVLFGGRELYALSDKEQSRLRCREIGFVFQFYNLIQSLTVEENILLPLSMAGEKTILYKERLQTLLEKLGLQDKRNATPNMLSGGQQQRVAIARALIGGAKLILADEPTGNLDSRSGEAVMALFDEIHRTTDVTVILVTHDPGVAAHSDRRIVMSDGVILSDSQKQQ